MNFEGFSTERSAVQTVTAEISTLAADLSESHEDRLKTRGGHFSADELIPVYFCALAGYDSDDTYNNLLFNIRQELSKPPKSLIFKDAVFGTPVPSEVSLFSGIDRTDKDRMISGICSKIAVQGDNVRTNEARRAFRYIMENRTEQLNKLYNNFVMIGCWFNRCYSAVDFRNKQREIPALIYYGDIRPIDLTLLHILSRSGMDVIYINPSKSCLQMLNDGNTDSRMQIFEMPESKEIMPYPDKEVKARVATAAYSAERELDTLLYSSDTMFRDFQFSNLEAAVLKTTYEEIEILWNQPSRFRPGFEVKGEKVKIPVLFTKISGTPEGSINEYWDIVRGMLTPLTVLTVKAPFYREPDPSVLSAFDPYHNGHKIFIDKLKNSRLNPYGFLSDGLQSMIFEKINETAESGYLTGTDERTLIQYILYAGLNIDRNIINIIQKYDFTKDIPKFIVIDTIENTFSLTECVQLVLFGMMGFDIAVFTPTGYRNMETFIDPKAYELHRLNDFKYNVTVPRFKIPDKMPRPKQKGGLFSNLFKKGRK